MSVTQATEAVHDDTKSWAAAHSAAGESPLRHESTRCRSEAISAGCGVAFFVASSQSNSDYRALPSAVEQVRPPFLGVAFCQERFEGLGEGGCVGVERG